MVSRSKGRVNILRDGDELSARRSYIKLENGDIRRAIRSLYSADMVILPDGRYGGSAR